MNEVKKVAIEVKDVCINYRILNSVSVQKSFLRKKVREEDRRAARSVRH